MNKIRYIVKIIKMFFKIVLYIAKTVFVALPRLLKNFFNFISKRLRFSITFKTTSTYTLIFSVILFILCTAFICIFSLFLIYESNQLLIRNSLVISNLLKDEGEIPQDKINDFARIEDISVIIFDKDGQQVYAVGETKNIISKRINLNYPLIEITPSTSLNESLHYKSRIKLINGVGTMEISKDLEKERFYLAALIIAVVLFVILAIIMTIIIGSKTSRRMLRPIDNMTRTARSISFGDLNTRLDVVDSHDELKEMAETFNEMLERIQSSVEQQNVFVSDASHELRTPIAVIQGYSNLLQRWGKEERDVLDESIIAIKNESDYMKELVEKLLFLASADKKAQKFEMNPFLLNELLDEVLKETRMIDTNHIISGEIDDNIRVYGERGLIKQALRIFMDNSLKYTPAEGSIKLSSLLGKREVMITVEDTGAGISAEDLPYIFNRFYKADKSRSREAGGTGLGLSIAKWIIEQHQGSIKVESTPNKGTKIIILLPALPPAQE
ncbi:MAG: ATP-binding protein [Syntrophomonadaceae bacterium]|nr:ATP-binding protein [Syntrophomonadaceae bacterium]MDD3024490.1 ATP-binding protein [Syntrophomonadaceae bacterium]